MYLARLLSFMEKGGSVKLVQKPGIHQWWEVILNSERTGAQGKLPVLQEETAEAFARDLESLKELLENVSSSQKALASDSDSHFPAWQEKENPQKSGLWLSGK